MTWAKGQKLIYVEFLSSMHLTSNGAIFALLSDPDLQAWTLHSPLQFSCSLYAGTGIAVSFFAQSWCISERGPPYCAMFNPLSTVITALISATFLQEEAYVGSLIGPVGVIAGLYIVLWGIAKESSEIKQEAPQSNLQDDEIRSMIDLEEPLLSEKSEMYLVEGRKKIDRNRKKN
ncbi:hypothetical protein JHK87_010876 [Glycine soja]|nr:hypothetical protein JHK87_010876 [Glycine soja]